MSADSEKRLAAARAVTLVEDGMTLGLGTGSTASYAIRFLGMKVSEGMRLRGVPTSEATAALARECGIPLISLKEAGRIDLTIDGADEVDTQMRMIKGGGGALLREKIVAAASDAVIIIVDASKVVQKLGSFPLPVEVVPFGAAYVQSMIESLGARPTLRGGEANPFITDDGHYILDCAFRTIERPEELSAMLNATPGVVDTGLFIGVTDALIVGRGDQTKVFKRSKQANA